MWVALLNLENMYSTEESLKKVFERALQFCEPMPVYQQLADIYTKSNKIKVQCTASFIVLVLLRDVLPLQCCSCVSIKQLHVLLSVCCVLCFLAVFRRLRACIRQW